MIKFDCPWTAEQLMNAKQKQQKTRILVTLQVPRWQLEYLCMFSQLAPFPKLWWYFHIHFFWSRNTVFMFCWFPLQYTKICCLIRDQSPREFQFTWRNSKDRIKQSVYCALCCLWSHDQSTFQTKILIWNNLFFNVTLEAGVDCILIYVTSNCVGRFGLYQ